MHGLWALPLPHRRDHLRKSSTSLHLRSTAMYLMSSTHYEASRQKRLERELGVTYKTAWRCFTLIRNELMTQDDEPLTGHVEADEMYHGGRPRKATFARPKTASLGRLQNGRIRCRRAWWEGQGPRSPDTRGSTLQHAVEATVVRNASVLYTDQAKQYHSMTKKGSGPPHHRPLGQG